MYNSLLNNLSDQSVVLTPNQRLCAHLRKDYDALQLSRGKSSWLSPSILPLTTWLTELWNNSIELAKVKPQQLLNSAQRQEVWQSIIENDLSHLGILNTTHLTQTVIQAWEMLQLWRVPLNALKASPSSDCRSFEQWINDYMHHCERHKWTDLNHAVTQLCEINLSHINQNIDICILVGFEELTPLHQKLFTQLNEQGLEIKHFETKTETAHHSVYPALDAQQELNSMVAWVKGILNKPNVQNLACIVPNLNALREDIEERFSKAFYSPELLCEPWQENSIFNISAGILLSNYSICYMALLMLELAIHEVGILQAEQLLRTPYLQGYADELNPRSIIISQLREQNIHKVSLNQLAYKTKNTCPILHKACLKLRKVSKDTFDYALPSQWSERFTKWLKVFSWPGDRELSSQEFQLVQRFQNLLSEFCALDDIKGTLSAHAALALFKKMASQISFQAKTPPNISVHILGSLEAAGLEFDAIWIMGLHNNAWPSPAKANPFIPISIQREYDLPHSSPERELRYSQQLLHRLMHSCQEMIASYPQTEGEESLAISPLISNWPETRLHENVLSYSSDPKNSVQHTLLRSTSFEAIADNQAPALCDIDSFKGGTGVLKQFAACPFKAFAMYRLQAYGLAESEIGLSALERGSILHLAIEHIWMVLQTHEKLCQLSEPELDELVEQQISFALSKEAQHLTNKGQLQYLNLEKQRLIKLLKQWLEVEKQRPPFKVIAHEQEQILSLGKLNLRARIDRLDETESGKRIIIDYKTGKTTSSDWFGPRPNEPQLPLYCISQDVPANALAFAEINADKQVFKGVSDTALDIDGIKAIHKVNHEESSDDWAQQVAMWRSQLQNLADEFYQGKAPVDPKDAKACMYCELHSLCRINEDKPYDE